MLQYSPKIITDSLVMCLDASQNKSYPTDLPVKNGLNLWLDAADDTTFSYSSGTVVSQWRDKSGLNNHAIVMAGSPLRSVAINSRKAVSFTSTTAFKCVTGSFSSTATHIVVCRATTSSATYQRVYHGGANSDFYVFIGAFANNISTFWGSGPSVWFDTNANSPSTTILNTLRIISAVNNGTTATPYYDGIAMSTKATTNSAAYTGYELNTYSNGAPYQPLIGEVCEIIVFNKQLSLTELKQVHTYLGQKWGISNTDRSIVDLSGNNNNGLLGNGTVANMPEYDYYNKGTLSFSQTLNDTVLTPLPITATPALSNFTYEVWTKLNRFPPIVSPPNGYGVTYRSGFLFGASYYGGAGLLWYGNTNGNAFNLYAFIRGTDAYRNTNAYSFNTDQYYHCVMVNNYNANKLQLFINGTLYSEVATATAQYDASNASAAGNIGISKAQIDGGGTANYSYYDGVVPVARIYNKALSAAEVAQNYEAQKSRFDNTIVQQGLVLNLDAGNPYSYAGAGTTWYDVSGNSNSGTLTNGPTYNSDAGGNIVFDGSNDYISIPSAASIKNTSTLSLEGWVFISSAMNYYGGIIGKGTTDTDEEYCLLVHSVNSKVYMDVGNSGGPYTDATYSFSLNTWYHIIGTHERTAGSSSIKIYINGSLLSSTTVNPTNTVNDNATNVSIGSRFNGGTSVWNGKIATARIYTRTLSATEVLQNYNATKGRFGL